MDESQHWKSTFRNSLQSSNLRTHVPPKRLATEARTTPLTPGIPSTLTVVLVAGAVLIVVVSVS